MSLIRSSRIFQVLLGILGVVLTVLLVAPGLVVEYLWMGELGYANVFWTIRGTQVVLFVLVFIVTGLYFGGNFYFLVRNIPPLWASQWAQEGEAPQVGGKPLTRDRLKRLAYVVAGVLSLLFAAGFSGRWNELLRFWYAGSYGQSDPIYGVDLAYHMLQLPFLQALQSGVVGLAFLGLLALVTGYVIAGQVGIQDGGFQADASALRHLGVNLIVLLLGWAWGFYLDLYEILQEGGGAVYGAGYTDVNVMIPALWIMVAATIVLAVLVGVNLYRRQLRLLGIGAIGYVVLLVGGLVLAPSLVTQLTVLPNELELERPYLKHNIELTREAYNLDKAQVQSYPARPNLTPADIRKNKETIENVRLWDPRLLIDTYKQLQQIRSYYEFYDVDVDRYTINGEYRQVMLSARELTQRLPQGSNSWVNRHLQYTHGYGSVSNLVARQGTEGSPEFLVKNLPPVASDSSLAVDNPSIYYGEHVPTYRLVDTKSQELHYPKGDKNVYTHYEGNGGVNIGGFWRKLLFAYYTGDFNILLTDYLTNESQIQIWNSLSERVRRIAPFLKFDGDPYFVLSDKRQYWIQDAYTTTRSFPYSEPIRDQRGYEGVRYIRNSVKIVVDAYSGEVSFYVTNTKDPVIEAYKKAFPGLFKPIEKMPDHLRKHVRYPQNLFEIQIEKYARYHMTEPQVFYNNEDLWTRPREQYAGQQRIMEPYYIMTKLPGQEKQQFMLMTPMTPENRSNMIGWIAAKSDPPNYGELVVYKLPKDRLIYGPNQVESRIDQDTEISRQLSLWDQRGSKVIRGNLIVVPIEESFLYVEPIFLLAQQLQIPQMQRVIVAYGERVAMKKTLRQSLNTVMGEQVMQTRQKALAAMQQMAGQAQAAAPGQVEELQKARKLIEEARDALQEGDFATFGDRFKELEQVLNDIPLPTDTTGAGMSVPSSDTTSAGPAAVSPGAETGGGS
ncbi:MAG: UPF0182 family protein [Salinibacter sp.]